MSKKEETYIERIQRLQREREAAQPYEIAAVRAIDFMTTCLDGNSDVRYTVRLRALGFAFTTVPEWALEYYDGRVR